MTSFEASPPLVIISTPRLRSIRAPTNRSRAVLQTLLGHVLIGISVGTQKQFFQNFKGANLKQYSEQKTKDGNQFLLFNKTQNSKIFTICLKDLFLKVQTLKV